MKIAFGFPGQGTQKTGMGKELFEKYRKIVERANEILGYSIEKVCLDENDDRLNDTEYSQPAIFIVNALSYYDKLEKNILPDYVLGHSLGEYNALLAANVFDFENGLKLVKKRAELMSKQKTGCMAAILGLELEQVKDILSNSNADNIVVSNINTFNQIVISGDKEKISTFENIFLSNNAEQYVKLNVNGAFHSNYMNEASIEFNKYIDLMDFNKMSIPVISNVTGSCYENDKIKNILKKHMCSPVYWANSIQFLLKRGVTEIQQVGYGNIVKNTVRSVKRAMKSME